MTECQCVPVVVALRLALDGQEIPRCPEHDQPDPLEPGSPVALNDSDGLTRVVSEAFATPVALTTKL